MKIKGILLSAIWVSAFFVQMTAQTTENVDNKSYIIIGKDIRLPKDSIERQKLIANLNQFLIAIQQPDKDNPWILPSEKTETELLTDEMFGMDKRDSITFQAHLINIEALNDKNSYLIQISYMGIYDETPLLRGIFELIAHKTKDGFLFSSPLARNTKHWNTKTIEYLTFHYQDISAENIINQWSKAIIEYDRKLNINQPMDAYWCDDCNDMNCMLHLTGIIYKIDFNSFDWPMMNYTVKGKEIAFYTQRQSRREALDSHDLFHWRANTAIPQEKRNFQMICGCAYIYGGSWMISWEDIQKMFKQRMPYDKKTDWLKLYYERYNFGESQAKHLIITQFINALIIQKTEKEQGFSAVMELLSSGNIYKEKENFFKVLEKVTGINEKNFNKKVTQLIQDASI
jgi:hypothetical protein